MLNVIITLHFIYQSKPISLDYRPIIWSQQFTFPIQIISIFQPFHFIYQSTKWSQQLTFPIHLVSVFQQFYLALFKDKLAESLCYLQKSVWQLIRTHTFQMNHIIRKSRKWECEALPRWKIIPNALSWKIICHHSFWGTFKGIEMNYLITILAILLYYTSPMTWFTVCGIYAQIWPHLQYNYVGIIWHIKETWNWYSLGVLYVLLMPIPFFSWRAYSRYSSSVTSRPSIFCSRVKSLTVQMKFGKNLTNSVSSPSSSDDLIFIYSVSSVTYLHNVEELLVHLSSLKYIRLGSCLDQSPAGIGSTCGHKEEIQWESIHSPFMQGHWVLSGGN